MDVVTPAPPPLVNIYDVELVHTGTWDISTGEWNVTRDDLLNAVAAVDCPAVRSPIIKIGHTDPRFDGQPAVGWIGGMATARGGSLLTGNYMGVPGWLASRDDSGNSVLSSAYPDRSVEGAYDFRCQLGHTHPFVLTAVALLGVTPPGVGTLQSLQDVAALYGVAASAAAGTPVAATFRAATSTASRAADSGRSPMPNPHPKQVAAGVTTEDVRRAYYDDADWSMWITEIHLSPLQLIVVDDDSGEHYRVPVTVTGEDTFAFGTPVEVLVRYVDAPADAEDAGESVAAAAQRIVYASRAESRPAAADAAAEPSTPSVPQTDPNQDAAEIPAPAVPAQPPASAPAEPETPAAEPETAPETEEGDAMSLDKFRSALALPDDADEDAVLAAVEALQAPKPDPQAVAASARRDQEFAAAIDQIKGLSGELAQIKAEKAQQAKDNFFSAAVQQGKLRPADRAAWEARYDQAPAVVTDIIGAMAAGSAVPVSTAGYVGDAEPMFDDSDLMGLLPPAMAAAMKEGN